MASLYTWKSKWTPAKDEILTLAHQAQFKTSNCIYGGELFWRSVAPIIARRTMFWPYPLSSSSTAKTPNYYRGLAALADGESPFNAILYDDHVRLFEDYIGGFDEHDYLLQWLREAVQRPDRPVGVGLTLVNGFALMSLLAAIVPYAYVSMDGLVREHKTLLLFPGASPVAGLVDPPTGGRRQLSDASGISWTIDSFYNVICATSDDPLHKVISRQSESELPNCKTFQANIQCYLLT
jgi:hypothetical protein